MGTNLSAYKGLYPQSDVYILGTSRKLLGWAEKGLKSKVCIGVNSSYLFKDDCSFYIGGHLIWALLWTQFTKPKHTCVYHGEPKNLKLPHIIMANKRLPIEKRTMDMLGKDNVLLGNEMIAYSATHLAVLIGAKRIIYIGFENKSDKHFTVNEPYYSKFYKHLEQTVKRFPKQRYHAEQMLKRYYPEEDSFTTARMRANYPKYLSKYRIIIDRLKQMNIFAYTTTRDSIIYEAGGKVW